LSEQTFHLEIFWEVLHLLCDFTILYFRWGHVIMRSFQKQHVSKQILGTKMDLLHILCCSQTPVCVHAHTQRETGICSF